METVKKIEEALRKNYSHAKYSISNSFIFNWESDFFIIYKNGYCVEIEIKVSRGDFFADFKKKNKHKQLLEHKKEKIVLKRTCYDKIVNRYDYSEKKVIKMHPHTSVDIKDNIIPNRFYYCVPEGLISKDEVPDYAGLIYFNEKEKYNKLNEVKKSRLLHKNKYLDEKWFIKILLEKFYWLSEKQRTTIDDLKQ